MKFWPNFIAKDVDTKINATDQSLISKLVNSFLENNSGSKLIDKTVIDLKWDFTTQALRVELKHNSQECELLFPKISIFDKENYAYFESVYTSFYGAFGQEPKKKIVGFRIVVKRGQRFLGELGFAVPSKDIWHSNDMRHPRSEDLKIQNDFFVNKEIPSLVESLNELLNKEYK